MRETQHCLILLVACLLSKSTATCQKNNTTEENNKIALQANSGELSSPGYPGYFSDSIQCVWLIHAAERHAIQLDFEFFDFGHSRSCLADQEGTYVEVRDGIETGSKPLGKFCGANKPEKISSSGNKMWVRFNANGYRSARFKASFTAVKDPPSVVLLVAGVSTIVGLMVVLLLLTLYLKRKRRHADEETVSFSGSQNQENNEQNRACSATSGDCIDLQFASVAGNAEGASPSSYEQELSTSCSRKERKCSQTVGSFSRENLAPVAE